MNLKLLASKFATNYTLYGLQAYGINQEEKPHGNLDEMAAEDIKLIKEHQPVGPYRLWGYSFGARVAFEAACQLEKAGEQVESLCLIAPGSPKVRNEVSSNRAANLSFSDRAFVTILFSVFAGSINHPYLSECLEIVKDEENFASFVFKKFKNFHPSLVRRIIDIVVLTYQFKYDFDDIEAKRPRAPIRIFKANGDNHSFIEMYRDDPLEDQITFDLETEHYNILRESGIDELARVLRFSQSSIAREQALPNSDFLKKTA